MFKSTRFLFIGLALFFLVTFCSRKVTKPNFIIIFCDDLGYGDLGCYGSEVHNTPHLDQMAEEGVRFTDFYACSSVCTPSRASLLTGCYPRRVNMHQDSHDRCVLFPVAQKGLNPEETTIADMLKKQGYATTCIGKWHLGDQPPFLPTEQGFDSYYGIPYSNDMGTWKDTNRPPLPLVNDKTVVEAPVEQATITKRYTEKALEFIRQNKKEPFFLYLPHTMPHNPVYASEQFRGRSENGRYGDAVEEIDWSTGQILDLLRELEIDEKTLVIFTSDNGAHSRWGGSNEPLRGWKGSTWEGGQRVPFIAWWPEHIPAGITNKAMTSTLDLLPTCASLSGASLPQDRIIDGKDISHLLFGKELTESPHDAFYYYQMDQLQCVRSGRWKLHLPLDDKKRNWGPGHGPTPARLYDLHTDIGEQHNVAEKNPEVVERLKELAEKARQDLGDSGQPGAHQRPAAFVEQPEPLVME